MMRVLLALMLVSMLAACGKKGPPSAPGPTDKVIYPKQYPSS